MSALLASQALRAASEQAATHRVSSAAEIATAASRAKPGDVIVMSDGVWKDADIVFDAQGTEGKPITLRAQTPGKLILSGGSRLRIGGAHLVVDGLWFKDGYVSSGDVIELRANPSKHAHHCRVTNCAITGYNPFDKKANNKWVSLYGAHNRVDHCALIGKENAGTTLVVWLSGEPNYHRIDHNYFGPRPPLGANGGETIRVGTSDWSMSVSRTIVERNLFEECNGEIEIISSKSCENVYRQNTFLNCEGTLTLRHGNRCEVHGNFFLGNHKRDTGGVRIIGEDHKVYNNYFAGLMGEDARSALSMRNGIPDSPLAGYFQVKRAVVAFNTLVDCRSNFALGLISNDPGRSTLPPEDCVIANNLTRGDSGPLIREMNKPLNLRWQGNIFHGAALGVNLTSGIVEADPRLRLGADGLWRPGADSPAIGAAVGDFPFVTDDIDGQPRGRKRDVGCDQSSNRPALSRPLTRDKVGPAFRVI